MQKRNAFTLIELLVVISIITLLIALLLPALAGSRKVASEVECRNNLKHLIVAQETYSHDHDGKFAPPVYRTTDLGGNWMERLDSYVAAEMKHCPVVPESAQQEVAANQAKMTYAVNSAMWLPQWQMKRDVIVNPSKIIIMGEKGASEDDYLTSEDGMFIKPLGNELKWIDSLGHDGRYGYWHNNQQGANMAIADGHVSYILANDLDRDDGHWYWGDAVYDTIGINFGIC